MESPLFHYQSVALSEWVLLQAMDTGGKDGTVRHVFGPLNPRACASLYGGSIAMCRRRVRYPS